MSYVDKIRQDVPRMSKSFKYVANYLIDSYVEASLMTASEVAGAINVDPATVVRLAQSLGYAGFSELHRELKDRVKNNLLQRASDVDVKNAVAMMRSFPYEEKIRRESFHMSKKFSDVAYYLVNSYVEAAFMTTAELAEAVNSDPATVVRFAQSLGYAGFPDLHREVIERAKSFFLLLSDKNTNAKQIPLTDVTNNQNIFIKKQQNKVIQADDRSMQKILTKHVEAIRAYLRGIGTAQVSDEKLCDWVQFCYTFEMYTEGRDLFALINSNEVEPWYYERTKKIARLCAMKVF